MSDPLHDELEALKADIHRVGLPDAVAVRRRGDQRRRRQRAGSLAAALAGVVVLGGGVVEIGAAGPEPIQPAHEPDVTTTEAPTPGISPTELDPLLQAAELPAISVYEWLPRTTYDPVDESPPSEKAMPVCGGDLSPMTDAQHTMLGIYPTELDASMREWVAEYATEAEAATAVEALEAQCRTSGGEVQGEGSTEAGTFTVSHFGSGPSSEYHGEVTGIARQGNVLVVLQFQGMVTAEDVDQGVFADTVVSAVERAGSALN